MKPAALALLLIVAVSGTGCAVWTPELRTQVIDTIANEVPKIIAELIDQKLAKTLDELIDKTTAKVVEKARELGVTLDPDKLKASVRAFVDAQKEKLKAELQEKAKEVIKERLDEALPEPEEGGGGFLSVLGSLLYGALQVGLAVVKK